MTDTARGGLPGDGPVVSVVIINFNGRRFLDELLLSLERQTLRDFETLFIDNGSSDQSAEYVRNNFFWVQVLAQRENLGFSRAANLGVERSLAPFVVFLNTDMKVEPDWLAELLKPAADPEVAAVASKLRLYHAPCRLNGVGGAMNRLGYTWDRGMFEEDRGQYDQASEVLFASAGAALFRKSAFLGAGGFDERFFMYHEDVDLCWRLWLLGFRILTAPRAVAFHHFGGSTKSAGGLQWREFMGERHDIRSLIKNYELRTLLPNLLYMICLRQPTRRKLYQIGNFLWNLWFLPETLQKRRWIQRQRRRSDQELSHLIVQSKDVPVRV